MLTGSLTAQKKLAYADALARALEENLDIQIAEADERIAETNANLGNAGFLPNVEARGSFDRSVVDQTQEIATDGSNQPAGPQEFPDAQSTNYNASLTANYVLFDGLGRLNNWQRLQLQEELSTIQTQFTIENVLLEVSSRFFAAAQAQRLLTINRQSVKLSLERYERAQVAGDLGTTSNLQELDALVDLREDSVRLLNSRVDFFNKRRELNQLLNFPVDTAYPLDTTLTFNRSLQFGALREEALQNNRALVQAQLNKELAEKQINIAWSERLPQISASGGYTYTRQENEGGFLRFTETEGWQYGLSAQWNIFNSYRTQTEIEAARIRVFQNDLSLEQTRLELLGDLSESWLDYENQFRIYRLQARNLKVARQRFKRAQEAYRLGQINSLELRDAQLSYIRAEAELSQLAYNSKLAEIELQRVVGRLIEVREQL